MPNLEQYVNFNPEKDIPELNGKVIFITGGVSLGYPFFINHKAKKHRNFWTWKGLSDLPCQAQPGAHLLHWPQQQSSPGID